MAGSILLLFGLFTSVILVLFLCHGPRGVQCFSEWKQVHEKTSPGIVAMNQAALSVVSAAAAGSQSHRRQVPTMTQPASNSNNSCSDDSYSTSLKNKFNQNVFSKTFANDSYINITVLWAGKDDSVRKYSFLTPNMERYTSILQLIRIVMVVTVNSGNKPSTLYISDDFGKEFRNLTKILNNAAINSVQQCPIDRKSVYLISYESPAMTTLYLKSNGSNNNNSEIQAISLPFKLKGDLRFHPNQCKRLLALGSDPNQMWKAWSSSDGGFTWKEVHNYVDDIQWSQHPNVTNNTFYLTTGKDLQYTDVKEKTFDLIRMGDDENVTVVAHLVSKFQITGKFIYALVFADRKRRKSILRVSTDGGLKWNEAQLAVLVEDKFYKVLDMSDGMVSIHVDEPKENGCGTLFTSDSNGTVFSESLRFHKYSRDQNANDFYKVKSMRGVYITSHLTPDHKQRSVITFNRGAKWQNIRAPLNVECTPPNSSICHLQITSYVKADFSVKPMSTKSAPGIILAHGFLGYSVPSSGPDVYVSSDGGYNWLKALNGPHLYAIADHGGLLVAVSISNPASNILKFSLDEGQTWYCYQFTNEMIKFTGLLTDPESWSLKVGVWGYGINDNVWRVTVIDFQPIIGRRCAEPDDFTDFVPHNDSKSGKNKGELLGCHLGLAETLRRVKKGKKCYLGQDHKAKKLTESCSCTENDYECDFGFHRAINEQYCVESPSFKGEELDICLDGEEKKIVTFGYRKIPGDMCEGGFDPGERYEKNIKVRCREGDKILVGSLRGSGGGGPSGSTTGLVILVILIIIMTGLIFGMSVFFIKKFNQVNNSPVAYRYTRLNQDDLPDESVLSVDIRPHSATEISSEDEEQSATLLVDTMDNKMVTVNGNRSKRLTEESDETKSKFREKQFRLGKSQILNRLESQNRALKQVSIDVPSSTL